MGEDGSSEARYVGDVCGANSGSSEARYVGDVCGANSGSSEARYVGDVCGANSGSSEARYEVSGTVTTGISLFALTSVAVGVAGIIGLLIILSRSTADNLVAPPTTTNPPTSTIPVPSGGVVRAPAETLPPPTTLVPGRFLLGEPTGLWLFYGGDDPMQRLNLDSGELITYGLEAFPVEATGDDLLLHQGRSGVSGWVPASDPGQQALTWKKGPVAPGPASGQVWVLDRDGQMDHPSGEPAGSGMWLLFDLSDNRVLDRRPGDLYTDVEAALAGSHADRFRVGPDYSNRPDGIYRYREEGYRRIADGQVLAALGEMLLVTDCTVLEAVDAAVGDCQPAWLNGETGGAFADPVPAGDIRSARFGSSGRWLIALNASGATSLIELASGEGGDFGDLQQITVSPDGRWLAGLAGAELVIEDLLGINHTFRYELPGSTGAGTLLMVER